MLYVDIMANLTLSMANTHMLSSVVREYPYANGNLFSGGASWGPTWAMAPPAHKKTSIYFIVLGMFSTKNQLK